MTAILEEVETPPSPVKSPRRMTAISAAEPLAAPPAVEVRGLNLFYGKTQALHNIHLTIPEKQVTAFIGPSGCGKSSLLRCFNRMNDLIDHCHVTGSVKIHGKEIYGPSPKSIDVISLRKRTGMIFQKPNPFLKSIYQNVIYSLHIDGITKKSVLDDAAERALRSAGLWEEVKDRLHSSAHALSGGQQQRLCIARAIAAEPEVLLMDEPCSALDPIATKKIEALIDSLRRHVTIIIVTHNMHQANRVADHTAFFYLGQLVEFGATDKIFHSPDNQQTEDYITGRFG
ncbi:MAG: phosphate ABC transporter ATP-binding protein PstB [Phycisphaerales bacterium]|nr:phosphate ABC transporter ATP-binding protein PstB [Phycisphaerales bacterium]